MAPRAVLLSIALLVISLDSAARAAFLETVAAEWAPYVNPIGNATSPWMPKTTVDYTATARTRDWAGVAGACEAVTKYESRFSTFVLKAAFHGSMGLNILACGDAAQRLTPSCGLPTNPGYLTLTELLTPASPYEAWDSHAKRIVVAIAAHHDVSVADTIAVCAAVGVEVLSGNRIKVLGTTTPTFRVGRLDSASPRTPTGYPADLRDDTEDWSKFWAGLGFNAEEGAALQGIHGLMYKQFCQAGMRESDQCDPTGPINCTARQHSLGNHFFQEVCSPTTRTVRKPPMSYDDTLEYEMDEQMYEIHKKKAMCSFSSPAFRTRALIPLEQRRLKIVPSSRTGTPEVVVTWSNDGCEKGAAWGAGAACPHSLTWPYATMDGYLGATCQSGTSSTVRTALRKFTTQTAWDAVLPGALRKMTDQLGRYGSTTPQLINGRECTVAWAPDVTCLAKTASQAQLVGNVSCAGCAVGTTDCHPCCRCPVAFRATEGYSLKAGASLPPTALTSPPPAPEPPMPPTANVDPEIPEETPITTAPIVVDPMQSPPVAVDTPVPAPAPALGTPPEPPITINGRLNPRGINPGYPTAMAAVPVSPYDKADESCSGQVVETRGYPSSPRTFQPFQQVFHNPPVLQPSFTECKATTMDARSGQTCIDVYNITVVETTVDLGIGCGKITKALAYNGIVPGPTIQAAKGKQTMVRFNNAIPADSVTFPSHLPCETATRHGRPLAIHLHGSASLAPYDGWAEDSICSGESKDYIYPNQRPNTGWYHDHQLEITGENAHAGMAGFYLIKQQSALGTAPDRWGLDGMEEFNLMLADRVLDGSCQLFYDPEGVHDNGHFGDINLVSGIPFPRIEAEPKWVRFRTLNAAVTRPYLLALVNNKGEEVSHNICYMLSSDGGYRRKPIPFPAGGLFMGVAERYDFACNLAAVPGQNLYLWNVQDEDRMKDVPFYCHSHLVAQIVVNTTCEGGCAGKPAFQMPAADIETHLDTVLPASQLAQLKQEAVAGRCDRTMVFGRSNGQWVINGETWQTNRVAADDVSLNSPEIWCLETGGGWFHPIHVHLIDMFVLTRFSDGAYSVLESYETDVPKDVVQLHPGSKVAVATRWGPHRGEYMFHCHNLRHEDHEMMRSFSNDKLTPEDLEDSPALAQISQMSFTTLIGGQIYDNYRDPMYPASAARPTGAMPNLQVRARDVLNAEMYRIFYPGINEREKLCDKRINPWLIGACGDCTEASGVLTCGSG